MMLTCRMSHPNVVGRLVPIKLVLMNGILLRATIQIFLSTILTVTRSLGINYTLSWILGFIVLAATFNGVEPPLIFSMEAAGSQSISKRVMILESTLIPLLSFMLPTPEAIMMDI